MVEICKSCKHAELIIGKKVQCALEVSEVIPDHCNKLELSLYDKMNNLFGRK